MSYSQVRSVSVCLVCTSAIINLYYSTTNYTLLRIVLLVKYICKAPVKNHTRLSALPRFTKYVISAKLKQGGYLFYAISLFSWTREIEKLGKTEICPSKHKTQV